MRFFRGGEEANCRPYLLNRAGMLLDLTAFFVLLENEGVQTHNGVLKGEKADLERRAERFARRVEEERALKETERLAHESRVRAIRAQVGTICHKMTGDTVSGVLIITKQTSRRM